MYAESTLQELDKRYVRDIWRRGPSDAVAELSVEVAEFGPVQAAIVAGEPDEPRVNVVLGASAKGAVAGGHLCAAVDWVASQGVDYRVPVAPAGPEARAAEHWLMARGHEQGTSWMKFAHASSSPRRESPIGTEVLLLDEGLASCETFSIVMERSFGAPWWIGAFFCELHCLPDWRAYVAYSDRDPDSSAGAAMLTHGGLAALGPLAPTQGRHGAECQAALLQRCVEDAAAAGCRTVFAETEAPRPGQPLRPDIENLCMTGFDQLFMQADWQPPRRSQASGPQPPTSRYTGPSSELT